MVEFFVSHSKADRAWAEWIAWQLESAGYKTVIQAWDFRPGCKWVLEMQRASAGSERTIAVLSPDYIGADYTHPEWAAAFAQDPQGWQGMLVPVRVRETSLVGLLSQIAYIELVGLDEPQARAALLMGVQRGRAKPSQPPQFPGAPSTPTPGFPGDAVSTAPSTAAAGGPAPKATAQSLSMFQRVYKFGVEQMHKTRYDAESFAADWVAVRARHDFVLFETIYRFAVEEMQKTRYDAEHFALRWLTDHVDHDFADFVEAYGFATQTMQKTRYDAEKFASERLRNHSQSARPNKE